MNSKIPAFNPTQNWYSDWPFETSTLVRVRADVSGSAAQTAVRCFLESLHRASDTTYFWGGYSVEVSESESGLALLFASAGEDSFDSVEFGTQDLVRSLNQAKGDVCLTWQELRAVKTPG